MKTLPFLILTVIIFIFFIPNAVIAKSVEVLFKIKEVIRKKAVSQQTIDRPLVIYQS